MEIFMIIGIICGMILVILILREFWCMFFKVNYIIRQLDRIEAKLAAPAIDRIERSTE